MTRVDARVHWTDLGIDVTAHARYEVTAAGTWKDASHTCGPEGWPGNVLVNAFTFLRRARGLPWGALVGCIDQQKPYFHLMPGAIQPAKSGRLFCFFNDAYGFYGNNDGALDVTVMPKF